MKAIGGDRHQLRDTGDIPVRIRDFGMADIDRQPGDGLVNRSAFFIKADDIVDDAGVAQIMQPMVRMLSPWSPPELTTYGLQGVQHGGLSRGMPIGTKKKGAGDGRENDLISLLSVMAQLLGSGVVHGHPA